MISKAWLLGIAALIPAFLPSPASAELPELRIAPLRYDAHLTIGQLKTGFVDASNPTGSTVHVAFQVQAFRQINDRGELAFYDDPRIAAAVTPAIPAFDLGPREAIRTRFTIDPTMLGPGGAYGVIFLRTVPTGQAPGEIATSARVGTLLILDVGGSGTRAGRLTGLKLPHFVFGRSQIPASFSYANTGGGENSLAFTPELTAAAGWTSRAKPFSGPFVFPHRSRVFSTQLSPGNSLGFIPVSLHDKSGGSAPLTGWIFAVTGIWAELVFLLPLVLILWLARKKLLIFWPKFSRSPNRR
jgi:hypothetical protein